ncbi:MAG: hypothetical protein M3T49_01235 [Candidatus Eremiobacteraeota bacterium]|nr:hypothetical protein [Candidatus Eremiobacteraeota bacterium]
MSFIPGLLGLAASGFELWQTGRLVKGLETDFKGLQAAEQSQLSSIDQSLRAEAGSLGPQSACGDAVMPRRPPPQASGAAGVDGLL